MFKKILCLAMALIMVAGMAVISASAADDTKIYFEVPSDWNKDADFFCHIWVYGGDSLANWQSKKEKCKDEGNDVYSFDISKVGGLEAGTLYGVIFSSNKGMQTYDLLMSTACYGDTVYCDGTKFENPADSNKTAIAAYWKKQAASSFGPIMGITSIGNVVGTCIAPGETAEGMFKNFLINAETGEPGTNFASAKTYAQKSEQAIIDDTAAALGLSKAQTEAIVKSATFAIDWSAEKSNLPEESKPLDQVVNTGREMTIVYIGLAMMIASAGVIFFARKKRVTE